MIRTGLVPRWVVRVVGFLLCCVVLLGWSLPATALGNSKNKLEEQVLEIIRQHPEALIESVRAYEQKQQEEFLQQQFAFLQQMRANPEIFVGVSPTLGAADAKVVLLEFSDFQCPYCAEAQKILKQFATAHSDQVRFVYKHFPILPNHAEALPAARAAWAAAQQGKFWEYHDALFSQQEKLGEPLYVATAKSLKLDLDKFNEDRQSERSTFAIQSDMDLAQRFGINGTPFIIMNGVIINGRLSMAGLEERLTVAEKEVAANAVPQPAAVSAQPSSPDVSPAPANPS